MAVRQGSSSSQTSRVLFKSHKTTNRKFKYKYNLSSFHDHMMLKEHFHWLVPQTVATQDAGQMLHMCNA